MILIRPVLVLSLGLLGLSTLLAACEPQSVCQPGQGEEYCRQHQNLSEHVACVTGSEDVYTEIMAGQNCFLPAYEAIEGDCRSGCFYHFVDETTVDTSDPATAGADAEGSVRLQRLCEEGCRARLQFEVDHASRPNGTPPDAGVPTPAGIH